MSNWEAYLSYLHELVVDHGDEKFKGMSPAGYYEWLDNECCEEDNDE